MPDLGQRLEDLKKRFARPASQLIVGGFRPPTDPYSSWFGKITLQRPGDDWPEGPSGPMWSVCQLIVDHAPHVPGILRDIRVIQVFADPKYYDCDTDAGEGWYVQTFTRNKDEDLVPTDAAVGDIKAFPARWELVEADYPVYDDLPMDTPDDLMDRWTESVDTLDGTKLGGWPRLIQSEIFWAPFNQHLASPEYVFQIDSETKAGWSWGDCGVAYFGRGTAEHRDQWAMSWQCF